MDPDSAQSSPRASQRSHSGSESPTSRKRSHTDMNASASNGNPMPESVMKSHDATSRHDVESPHQSQDADSPHQPELLEQDQDENDVTKSLANFDWDQFEAEYHSMIAQKESEEQILMHQFDDLCRFFGTWADVSSTREVERSYKRLKTQSAYVQNEEAKLEQRRNHYVKVVEAFKAALSLLE